MPTDRLTMTDSIETLASLALLAEDGCDADGTVEGAADGLAE